MLATTGVLVCAVAVIAVALEATWPAVALGSIGMWMMMHGT
jgi:hypothetical protein